MSSATPSPPNPTTHPEPIRVDVRLPGHDYPVLVGSDLLPRATEWLHPLALGRHCAVVTDSHVAPLHLPPLLQSLEAGGFHPVPIEVPAGEASKSFAVLEQVLREMTRAGLDRHSWLLALGGGVVGDLAGFAAAVFQRGIPFVQLPTTIVSQVDSSVGGKTGINLPEGKNLIGAFQQPALVLADIDTLATLPAREWNEGFAEVVKHAAIRDAAMLDLLPPDPADAQALATLIARNVAIKARIVEADERETSGTRALLNFGHTIGHGIEAAAGYGRLLHGEAIALGLVAACDLSERHAGLDPAVSARIRAALEAFDLPLRLPDDLGTDSILAAISRDKKFAAGAIRFVLLRAPGDAFVSPDITTSDLADAIARLRGRG